MNLLIAEKPSVAISSYKPLLESVENEVFVKKDGFLQGRNWTISWCVGHLVQMAYPEDYGWKEWKVEDLPMLPKQWKYTLKPETAKQFQILRDLMGKAELVVIGTDAGREGELIYRLVKELAGYRFEEKRLWINSYVLKDMVKGWKNLKPSSAYDRLYYSALCRAKSDWLVGMNFSRGYALKTGARQISVGRVQTPTLALIVDRDQKVENWKESFFFELSGLWKNILFTYFNDEGQKEVENYALLEMVLMACKGKPAELVDKVVSDKSTGPGKPFDLVGLQKEANRRFGLKAQETLDAAQSLYEGKFITYPRTDSEYLPTGMKEEAYNTMVSISSNKEKGVMRPFGDSFFFFNDSKVTDHFAIIPTGLACLGVSDKEGKVYQLIRDRFVMAFARPYRYRQTDLVLKCSGAEFRASLKMEIDKGFKALDESSEEEGSEQLQLVNADLNIEVGESAPFTDLRIDKKNRTKPKYHTEASLLGAMETAGRQVTDEKLKEVMKGQGLGTPATRAGIIEILKKREYVRVHGKFLVSTQKGRELIKMVDELVASPEMTGQWEFKLKKIQEGVYSADQFMTEISEMVRNVSKTFSVKNEGFIENALEPHKTCPDCKGPLRITDHGAFCGSCDFKMWRSVSGKKLSDKVVFDLIIKGQSGEVKGFKSKSGKPFGAKLRRLDGGKLEFVF